MGLEAALIAAGVPAAAAGVASSVIGVGVSVGISYAAQAFTGRSAQEQAQGGLEGNFQLGGDIPRGYVVGRQVIEGHLSYPQVGGSFAGIPNLALDRVFTVGDGPHDALEALWADGIKCTLVLQDSDAWRDYYTVQEFNHPNTGAPCMQVWFVRGRADQPSLSELVANSNPTGRWTAENRGAGVAYVAVRMLYFKQVYDSIPMLAFGVRGRRFYDWRYDTTAGGSGAQRWGDQGTWAYSANPFVSLYNFQRGLFINGQRLVGAGVQPIDLVLDAYTAAANACDEAVEDSAGVSADRYSIGTYVSDNEEHAAVIQRHMDACGGAMIERAGSFAPIAGVAQPTLYPTITDADLVSGLPVKFSAKRGRAELVNGIFGTYCDLDQKGAYVSYPSRIDVAAEAADTEQRRKQSDYRQVNDPVQAQRLAELELALSRLQATATFSLGMEAEVLEAGDWVRWNSGRYGDRRWVILKITEGRGYFTLDLRQVSATAFGEIDDIPVNSGPVADRDAPLFTVPNLTPLPHSMPAPGGGTAPAIAVYWTTIEDETVDACIMHYRVKADPGTVYQVRADDPSSGFFVITSGVQPLTLYEVSGTIETTPPRFTAWTDWEEVTTTELRLTVDNLPLSVIDIVNTQIGRAFREYDDALLGVNDAVAIMGAAIENLRLDSITAAEAKTAQVSKRLTVVEAQNANWGAQISDLELAMVTADGALATRIGTVSATGSDNLSAAVVAEQTARANADTAIGVSINSIEARMPASNGAAAAATKLAALIGGDGTSIAMSATDLAASYNGLQALTKITAVSSSVSGFGATSSIQLQTIAGSSLSGLHLVSTTAGQGFAAIEASKFLLLNPGGAAFAVFDIVGGSVYLKGNLYLAGTLDALAISINGIPTNRLANDAVTIYAPVYADSAASATSTMATIHTVVANGCIAGRPVKIECGFLKGGSGLVFTSASNTSATGYIDIEITRNGTVIHTRRTKIPLIAGAGSGNVVFQEDYQVVMFADTPPADGNYTYVVQVPRLFVTDGSNPNNIAPNVVTYTKRFMEAASWKR